MPEQVSVRVVRTIEEIGSIRSAWECWKTHPHADVEFYLGKDCAFPGFVRPHIIVIYRRENPDAMLVGKLLHTRIQDFSIGPWCLFKPRVRVLRFRASGLLGNLSEENCSMLVREVMASLRKGEADMAGFWNLRTDGPMVDAVIRQPSFLERDPFPEADLHYGVNLPADVEDLYRELPPEVRWNLRRCARRSKQIEKEHSGSVTCRCYREAAELDQMVQDVEEVAKKSWQRGLGKGFANNDEMRRRYDLAARSGSLRTYIMCVGGRPYAYWVGTLYDGTYYTDFAGYDPAFAKYSPGTCLLIRVLDDLCRDGVRRVDFYHGAQEYKQRFGNYKWQEASVHIYSPSPRGLALKVLRAATSAIYIFMKGALQYSGFLKALRKAWRRHVTPQETDVRALDGARATKPRRVAGEQGRARNAGGQEVLQK